MKAKVEAVPTKRKYRKYSKYWKNPTKKRIAPEGYTLYRDSLRRELIQEMIQFLVSKL